MPPRARRGKSAGQTSPKAGNANTAPPRQRSKPAKPTLLLLLVPGILVCLAAYHFGRSDTVLQSRQASAFSPESLLKYSHVPIQADVQKRDAVVEAFQVNPALSLGSACCIPV